MLSLQIQVDERDPFQKFFEEIGIQRIKSNGRSSKSYNLYTSSFGHKVIDILLRNGFSNITPLLDNYIIEGFKVNFSNKKFEGYFKDKLISSKYQPAVKWIKKDLRLGNIRRSK